MYKERDNYFFRMLLCFVMFAFILFVSCVSKKTVTDKVVEDKTTEIITVITDSIKDTVTIVDTEESSVIVIEQEVVTEEVKPDGTVKKETKKTRVTNEKKKKDDTVKKESSEINIVDKEEKFNDITEHENTEVEKQPWFNQLIKPAVSVILFFLSIYLTLLIIKKKPWNRK